MAIRLISAMLVMGSRTRDGKIVLVEPEFGIDVPTSLRDEVKEKGKRGVMIVLPPYELILLMWGGTPGQKYQITGSFGIRGDEPGKAVSGEMVWPDHPGARINLSLQGKINFEKSAVYEFRFVANDEPLGVLPVVIRWEDETEF